MKRYDVQSNDRYDMEESPDGCWVSYEDAAAAVVAEQERIKAKLMELHRLENGRSNVFHWAVNQIFG